MVNAVSGEPLRKAQIVLRPLVLAGPVGTTTATVGDDGGFVLTSVSPGQYQLNASRNGFVSQGYGAPPASFKGTPIDITAGQTIGNLIIRMLPQGVIEGRVFDEDGDPIERTEVELWRFDYPDGDRQLVRQPFGNPGTNDLGQYRFSGLPPGSYIVSARVPLSNSGGKQLSDTDSVATYYPRSIDANGAVPIEVTAGSDARGIDIRILKSRLFPDPGHGDWRSGDHPSDARGPRRPRRSTFHNGESVVPGLRGFAQVWQRERRWELRSEASRARLLYAASPNQ